MRVLIGTIEISGIATELCAALCEAGVDAETVFQLPHKYVYDKNFGMPWGIKFWQFLGKLRSGIQSNVIKIILKGLHLAWGFLILAWAASRFDTFVFLFGVGITNTTFEFMILRFLKKKLIFFYVGSDERPPYMDGAVTLAHPEPTIAELSRLSSKKRRQILRCERYADICIASPFSGQFHSRPFVNCFSLGIPKHCRTLNAISPQTECEAKVRIVHAPSQAESKGSVYITQMIERLRAKGYSIEFVTLEGVPNGRVIEEISRCDFVVDQAFSDTPMAAFATEAASMGKPSVVGGYMATEIRGYLDDADIPPTMYVHPDELESAIERMIFDVDFRRDLGARARNFVATRWSPKEISRRYMLLFAGDIPESWWFDPKDIRYVHGYGMSETRLKNLLEGLILLYGAEVLGVSDKPELEQQFLDLIRPLGEVAR